MLGDAIRTSAISKLTVKYTKIKILTSAGERQRLLSLRQSERKNVWPWQSHRFAFAFTNKQWQVADFLLWAVGSRVAAEPHLAGMRRIVLAKAGDMKSGGEKSG